MSTKPTSQRAKSLTPEAFSKFLQWLSQDKEQAAKLYLEIRGKLVKFFVRKGCADSENLTDQTLDRVAAIVHDEPEKYPTPMSLCCGVAKKVWFEHLRIPAPGVLESENIAAPIHDERGFSDCEERCLGTCLEELSQVQRDLIIKYHQHRGAEKIEVRKRLAEEHGGLNKLRITAYRIRVRLHDCISGCVQRSAPN
ncbi:MAG TPA: hypothetical protein VKZ53_27715 [Candidatus Angelobacter sp.]|nr:hypothetical protein [Candidatus Angelobacter sp.]